VKLRNLTINGKNYRNVRRCSYCYYGIGERWWRNKMSVTLMHGRRKAKHLRPMQKRPNRSWCRLGWLGTRNSVLHGGNDPRRGKGNFWRNMCLGWNCTPRRSL